MDYYDLGWNDKCPCGSGLNVTHCHGASIIPLFQNTVLDRKKFNARLMQIFKQQGYGKPINSYVKNEERTIKVGKKTYNSTRWKTFHNFLYDYLIIVLGKEWLEDFTKHSQIDHPLLDWYHKFSLIISQLENKPSLIHYAPMSGAISAYLRLSYNLYLISHNSTLATNLISRLKNPTQFYPAYYEI